MMTQYYCSQYGFALCDFYEKSLKKLHQTGMCILYYRVVTKDLVVDLTQRIFYHIFTTGTEVDNEEIDILYPSVTVELQDYSSEFGEFERTVSESVGCNSHMAVLVQQLIYTFFS